MEVKAAEDASSMPIQQLPGESVHQLVNRKLELKAKAKATEAARPHVTHLRIMVESTIGSSSAETVSAPARKPVAARKPAWSPYDGTETLSACTKPVAPVLPQRPVAAQKPVAVRIPGCPFNGTEYLEEELMEELYTCIKKTKVEDEEEQL